MMDESSKQAALTLAREALRTHFGLIKAAPPMPTAAIFQEQRGVFVTLTMGGKLRGCIGDLEANKPLCRAITELAVAAATRDPRFPPLVAAELDQVDLEISLLTPLQPVSHWHEIKLSQHGVMVENQGRRGLFLPQVATETMWDLETFLRILCSQKAGLPPDAYLDPKTKLFTFEAEVIKEN
ncbi:hypothetical protein A2W24_04400 [Microgenomates group bacterium RBG_16_45_19]|nr:MAG: hypothetical protein A2W24_04400 [Microgenomates group bacterium RBG_16_45_19]